MKQEIKFEPVLSNFLDESFSNGSGSKPKKAKKAKEPKQKKVKKSKTSSRSDDTYVGRSREGSDREAERGTGEDTPSSGSSKPKLTAEQIQQGVDVATQVGGIVSQLPKNQAKKDLKAVCGRRPLLRKKRADWDKCASDYVKSKKMPQQDVGSKTQYVNTPSYNTDEKKFYQKPIFIIGVSAVVLIGGFLAYKYFKKTPTPVPEIN